MKQLLVLICLLVASHEASAQNWFRTAGPVEDDVLDLCIDSNGILYAVTPLGVNRSTDGGKEWTRPFVFPQQSMNSRIIVAPNGNIVASTEISLFVSTDKGSTFLPTRFDSVFNPVQQFAVTGRGRIFAGMKHSFLMSDDHGLRWEDASRVGLGSKPYEMVAVAALHDTVIAINSDNFFISFDDGDKWYEYFYWVGTRLLLIHSSGAWLLADGFSLYRFSIASLSWVQLPNLAPSRRIKHADVMPSGMLLSASNNDIMRSDSLTSWTDISSGFERNTLGQIPQVVRFVFDPKLNVHYAATRGAGVWKSASVLQSAEAEPESLLFSVSPNPITDRTTIRFTGANPSWTELELRNILGAVVWKQGREFCPPGTTTLSIAVHGLPPGNYLLVLRTSERTETQWVTIVE